MYQINTKKIGVTLRLHHKLWLVMRLITVILLVTFMQVSAASFGQRITLDHQNVPLKSVLREIRQQSGYDFYFDGKTIQDNQKISVRIKDLPIEDALLATLSGLSLTYEFEGKTIAIKKKEQPNLIERIIDRIQEIEVRGKIVDEKGEPLPGAVIKVKGTANITTSDKLGFFILKNVNPEAFIEISSLAYKKIELKAKPQLGNVSLEPSVGELEEINVVNTGYQKLKPNEITGSVVTIDNELLNRKISPNILERLDGVTSGLLFNPLVANSVSNFSTTGGEPAISIRGRSTIFANTNPLIILDNFPYTGDISNINPNDVENISVLKDASAAAIWGARSANGVIVITTKTGKLNQTPKIDINLNTRLGEIPDLFYENRLSSRDFVDLETYLFNQGRFNTNINQIYGVISPVVDILVRKQNNQITTSQAETELDVLRKNDVRDQLKMYYYRPSLNQQYQFSLAGGGQFQKYYLSAGYDNNHSNQVGNKNDRFTINVNNTYNFLKNRLFVKGNIVFTTTKNNSTPTYNPTYPYELIADNYGNALPIYNHLRRTYVDTAGAGKLLDWKYKPLDELRNYDSENKGTDYRINLEVNYKIFTGFDFLIQYQYGRGLAGSQTYHNDNSFFTRNLINNFSSINYSTGEVTRPIPLGGILDNYTNDYSSNFGRAQFNYNKKWGNHEINAISAFEINTQDAYSNRFRYYGYNPALSAGQVVNNIASYPQYFNKFSSLTIPNTSFPESTADRFRSYLANFGYNFLKKYFLSASVRKDESNIFGVTTNQKGVPLWSMGTAWEIGREGFYQITWLPELRLRITTGYNGNVDRSLSAYLTAENQSFAQSVFGQPYAQIVNPPNPSLRWEKILNTNLALDFTILKSKIIKGSIEIFRKYGKDLIGNAQVAPQTGLIQYRGNVSEMKTKGLDLTLNAQLINGKFNWHSDFLFSYVKDKITKFYASPPTNYSLINNSTPLEGYPYSALFSFPYAGLDNLGNPLGFYNGSVSNNYSAILNSLDRNGLRYHGTKNPTLFGSLRNTFEMNGFTLSFNLIYKFNYHFRRSSLNNGNAYATTFTNGLSGWDYHERWKVPGDEMKTNVPSLIFLPNGNRDNLYRLNETLIRKADNIRLNDLQLSYRISKSDMKWLPFKDCRLNLYVSNVGILWRANDEQIDPDAASFPIPRTYALGLNLSL